MRQLGLALVDLMLIFNLVLFGLVLVDLSRPDDEGLMMSQDILLDSELHHLGRLTH